MQRQSCHNSHATTIKRPQTVTPPHLCHDSHAKTVRPAVPRQSWQMPRACTLIALTHARVPCSCQTISTMYLQFPAADLRQSYAGFCDDLAAACLGQSRRPLGHVWCCNAANLCHDNLHQLCMQLGRWSHVFHQSGISIQGSPLTAWGTLQERTCTHKLYRHSSVTSRPPPAEC